jgi:hypothetical protein
MNRFLSSLFTRGPSRRVIPKYVDAIITFIAFCRKASNAFEREGHVILAESLYGAHARLAASFSRIPGKLIVLGER